MKYIVSRKHNDQPPVYVTDVMEGMTTIYCKWSPDKDQAVAIGKRVAEQIVKGIQENTLWIVDAAMEGVA